MNTYDTSLFQKSLNEKYFKEDEDHPPNYHIVNTCAVTRNAVLDSLRWIRNFKKKNPNTHIVVTGCGSQVELDFYKNTEEIDLIIANSHKGMISQILTDHSNGRINQRVFHSNIFKHSTTGEGGVVESHHTRFFLKIQDGCSQFCTFCIIPFARGKSRSLSPSHLIDRINEVHQQGILEVVLTGVHIGDYTDPHTKQGLAYLVDQILKNTNIPRIRLSSLEPIELTDELLEVYQNPRMCQHFHLSIQSGNSKILKDMKRTYGQKHVEKCLNVIHKNWPDAFVGMDLIAGFPGETQSEFEDTYELFKNHSWTHMHVFPYSSRPMTYAARRTDHLSPSLITRRASLLRNLSHERFHSKAQSQVGQVKQILPLKQGGISRDYWSIRLNDTDAKVPTDEYQAKLLSWNPDIQKFTAEMVS